MPATRRTINVLVWLGGAVGSVVLYRYVAVYLLGEVDHAYGKLASFQLTLVLYLVLVVAGLVGYAAISALLQRFGSVANTFFSGVAFAVCVVAFTFALGWAFPNSDVAVPAIFGALVLGALSTLALRSNAA